MGLGSGFAGPQVGAQLVGRVAAIEAREGRAARAKACGRVRARVRVRVRARVRVRVRVRGAQRAARAHDDQLALGAAEGHVEPPPVSEGQGLGVRVRG